MCLISNKETIKLDSRLLACAGLVRQGSSVADIGTDHALLPCLLWQSGKCVDLIAADINEKPLVSARRTAEKYNADVELVLSDGFAQLPPCDDVIISGMGGELIAEILAGCKHKNENTRFILQPMTRHEELRRALYRMGFEIITEVFAESKNKIYTVIHAKYTGEKREIDDVFAFCGKQTNPLYIKKQKEKAKKLSLGNPHYAKLAEEIEDLL